MPLIFCSPVRFILVKYSFFVSGNIMENILGLMSKDDWIYTGLLLFSFGASCYVRKIGNNILASGALGFAMSLFIIGN